MSDTNYLTYWERIELFSRFGTPLTHLSIVLYTAAETKPPRAYVGLGLTRVLGS